MSEWIETVNTAIPDRRSALMAGETSLPVSLGLTVRAPHVERAERDCLGAALPALAVHCGPAARVIEIGPFAGHVLGTLLNALERPKAGVIMTTHLDSRQFARVAETNTTAQITHINHEAAITNWPLEKIGAGKTLIFVGGGGFGLCPASGAFDMLKNASGSLSQGDFVAITLEIARDGATMDALYQDFGSQIVTHALASLGRPEGLDARSFYDGKNHKIRFGAVAGEQASLSWNGTRCGFEPGTWLDMGAMTLHTSTSMADLHPDFEVCDQWQSQDKVVTLLLLRKT